MRLPLLLSLLALVDAASAQPRVPDGGAVIEGGDSVEGCVWRYLTTARLDGRATPTTSGRVIRTVEPNRRIDANDRSSSWTVVRRPGRLRAARALTLSGVQRFGTQSTIRRGAEPSGSVTLRVPAGGTVEYLMDTGEGYGYFRYGGSVYHGDGLYDGSWTTLSEPVTELWLRLVARDRRPAAWVEVSRGARALDCDGAAEW